jgi:hypothetical protein
MKLNILQALRHAPLPPVDGIKLNFCSAGNSTQGDPDYAKDLQARFRDNLIAVLVYGSATFSSTPGDYDNYVVVKDLELAYIQARQFDLKFNQRPVHLNLIPHDLSVQILTLATMPSVRPPWIRVIFGEIDVPELPDNIVYLQGLARAIELLERRRCLLDQGCDELLISLADMRPEDCRATFNALAYLPAVMIEWTRLFRANPSNKPFTKVEILKQVRAEGFYVPEYSDSLSGWRDGLTNGLLLAEGLLKRLGFSGI